MLRHPLKIQARVSGKAALFTAGMLMLASVAQYALENDYAGGNPSGPQGNENHSLAVTPAAHEAVAAEVAETPVRGGNISLMIFRIN
jgi:hypothetical protein